jgi:hypothetical protein
VRSEKRDSVTFEYAAAHSNVLPERSKSQESKIKNKNSEVIRAEDKNWEGRSESFLSIVAPWERPI